MNIARLKAQLRQELTFQEVEEMEVYNADLYDVSEAVFKVALDQLRSEFKYSTPEEWKKINSNALTGRSASAERIEARELWGTKDVSPVSTLDLEDSSEIRESHESEKLDPKLRKLLGAMETERERESQVSKAAKAMGATAKELTGVFDQVSYGRPPPKEAIIELARDLAKSKDSLTEHRREFFSTHVSDITGLRKTGKDHWVATVALVWDMEKGKTQKVFVDVPINAKGEVIGDAKKSNHKQPFTRAMVRELITHKEMGYERPNEAISRAAFKASPRSKDWNTFNDSRHADATLHAMRPIGDGRFLVKVGFSWENLSVTHVRQNTSGWAVVNEAGSVVDH
jgi:hypothetical protein